MRLAEPLQIYDLDVVHEFYANAWAGEDEAQKLGSRVRGRWVPFDMDFISAFLGDPLQLRRNEDCTNHRLKDQFGGFNDDIVAREICLANHTNQTTTTGRPWRILRKHVKTLSEVWMVFTLATYLT